ncbi:MAG: S-methyl-5-thioribose-1-phosphate isomerase [Candidatus Hodarchaeales archaeon]|jgi:translation initiation factor eIF-2B subunit alpha/methylthioribose-1-phosphate isomerase
MKLVINGEITDLPSVWWDSEDKTVKMIDQTILPHQTKIHVCKTYKDTADAIKQMKIRGAPSIGAAAAYGLVQAVNTYYGRSEYLERMEKAYQILFSSRPTAIDLKNGLEFVKAVQDESPEVVLETAKKFADNLAGQGKKIGEIGKTLIKKGMNIITHCHTGALAVVDWGTAIAPLIFAWKDGIKFHVYVDETRPRMQGRLTSWELTQYNIPNTVICDSASAYLMSKNKIDMVILGADRVTRNGDVVNKIGTYNLAVQAKFHEVPFYTAFPTSTFDYETEGMNNIPVEERNSLEISQITGYSDITNEKTNVKVYSSNTKFFNPAFDITPAKLISGYITHYGILSSDNLSQVFLNSDDDKILK